jgi:hypothetical protein
VTERELLPKPLLLAPPSDVTLPTQPVFSSKSGRYQEPPKQHLHATYQDYIVALQIRDGQLLAGAAALGASSSLLGGRSTARELEVVFRGKVLAKCRLTEKGRHALTGPLLITIPRGTALADAALHLVLRQPPNLLGGGYAHKGEDEETEEVCRATLRLDYLVNTPVVPVDHFLSLPQFRQHSSGGHQDAHSRILRVARVQTAHKVFTSDQVVAFQCNSLSIHAKFEFASSSILAASSDDIVELSAPAVPVYEASIKWNGKEVQRVTPVKTTVENSETIRPMFYDGGVEEDEIDEEGVYYFSWVVPLDLYLQIVGVTLDVNSITVDIYEVSEDAQLGAKHNDNGKLSKSFKLIGSTAIDGKRLDKHFSSANWVDLALAEDASAAGAAEVSASLSAVKLGLTGSHLLASKMSSAQLTRNLHLSTSSFLLDAKTDEREQLEKDKAISDESHHQPINQAAEVPSSAESEDVASSPLYNLAVPLPPFLQEFEFNVLSIEGLPRANLLGLSDPYCTVRWGHLASGAEGPLLLGKTTVKKENLDPVWEESQDIALRVPRELKLLDVASSSSSSIYAHMSLILEVYDWNRVGAHELMGSLVLRGAALRELLSSSRPFVRRWFDLVNAGAAGVSAGKVQIVVNPREAAQPQGALRPSSSSKKGARQNSSAAALDSSVQIEIAVCSARLTAVALGNTSTTGSSATARRMGTALLGVVSKAAAADPDTGYFFVKCRWGGKFIGRSNLIEWKRNGSSLVATPKWEDERFVVSFPSLPPSSSQDSPGASPYLHLELWRQDTAGAELFLGAASSLSDDDVRALVLGSLESRAKVGANEREVESAWLPLGKTDCMGWHLQTSVPIDATLEVRISAVEEHALSNDWPTYRLSLTSVRDLSSRQIGLSLLGKDAQQDCIAIFKWNKKELYRTSIASHTLNHSALEFPSFLLTVSDEANEEASTFSSSQLGSLEIFLWDYGYRKGIRLFLGCVSLNSLALAAMLQSGTPGADASAHSSTKR